MTNTQTQEHRGLKKGSRVKLIETKDPYTDLKNFEYIGTVQNINFCKLTGYEGFYQIWVNWDNGSYFAIVDSDKFEVLK